MASQTPPILITSQAIDLSARFRGTTTVVASPAASSETIIASVTLSDAMQVISNVKLFGWAAFTVGTNGVSAKLNVRKTDVSGTIVGTTGALTVTAANLVAFSCPALDTGATLPGQVYVLTLTIGSGSATSTVSAVNLRAEII